MSTTAVTNKSLSLHPDEDKTTEQMDLDREISPAAPLQREDQEMQEPQPQPPVNPEEPRSTEPASEQEQTPDGDSKDSTPQHHENASKQPQQPAARIEHSYRHGSMDETHRQVDRPDLSYQHVQSYRHDSEHRNRTQPSPQSYRYGPEQQQQQQQVSYHYGREQERSHSHQKEQNSSSPPTQTSLEHPHQHQEHTTQDYSIQEGSNHEHQKDCDISLPVSSEPSPVIKQSPGSSSPPSFDVAAVPAVDHEELPHAQTSSSAESGDAPQSRPIGSPEDHPRDVKHAANMLSPEPRPNNKRHSVSDEPDPADLVDPSTEAGTSSLDHPGTGASGSGGNAGNSGDESSGSYPRSSKVPRKVREPVRKIPKVYPPRKPRVRPVAVEHLTMTIRTDSALSTLASAAVAIKDHQGPLSTLSVPPLSPTIRAPSSSSMSPPSHHHHHDGSSSSSTSTPKVPIAPTSTGATAPGAGAGAGAGSGGSQAGSRGGRASNKASIPQDAGGYRCELCPGERFGRVHDLKRHQISKHNEMTWPCDFCHRPFVRRDALLRHYAVKASRRDGVHPTAQEESRLQEAKARAKLLS
ncbi:hypothetical protein BGZ96_008280 [Linnemannia gamsii]|uniref:C2H2-type domain-containing protein n=1 Tax=Linnemannia gamsii TaxID=64522 RepID=A0ABQ7JZ34_9FUNG|nr:hypothetical protein BGZ96_008280 [Linnemannia gamsii]